MKFNVLFLAFLASLTLFEASVEALSKPLFINCGSNSSITVDGRRWTGDSIPGQNFTLSSVGVAAAASTISEDLAIYGSLYQTARIFNTSASFNFAVVPGNYFIRLHYCPFNFGNFIASGSSFDLLANNLKLLSKFNAPGEIDWKNAISNSSISTLVREFSLSVNLTELRIEFIPEPGSFAFVNALEVIPVVDKLFPSSSGMETMYRLNVGGREIEPSEDRALWRNWNSDEHFMFSVNAAHSISNTSSVTYSSVNDTDVFAPLLVYETARTMTDNQVVERRFNVSRRFPVDPNFDYLIRLHFSELVYDKPNQRIFRIYINNKTAAENFDVFVRAGGKNKAYHKDYVTAISPKVDSLWLQLGPDSLASGSGGDALLNGVEIFKLSRNGILAHSHQRIRATQSSRVAQKPSQKTLWAAVAAAAFAFGLMVVGLSVYVGLLHRRNKTPPEKKNPESKKNAVTMKTSFSSKNKNRVGRRFTMADIKIATRNFDESLVIGTGGFGKVYRGEIDEGVTVAIKRADKQSEQGVREFETEIEMLSKLRHRHLVSMIGFCDEQGEMVLVYEYMANGTLRSHLVGGDRPSLTWRQRLGTCIGAARGLHYLHTGSERGIIHRDVKSTNILLDEDFVAKVADFGLSRDGPAVDQTHVSTAVKGSFGYLDPEYFRRLQLTEKSDLFSFGVVLLEVVCARPVIDTTLPNGQINLAEWALRQRPVERIVDPRLKEEGYSPESVEKFVEIAEKCLADEGKNRPTMGEVLWQLENVLRLYEAHVQSGVEANYCGGDWSRSLEEKSGRKR
ncbi:probable receptor-like protein kinase At1g30570 [Zingiber officinale]|uniref:probable receptor-like protein kinase At1g30570 n=1 Tax=Zingiber officinale TaxID=94328 RepID=UPI001C4AB6CF|nr:probable receptor-like protein kinase At1g30570 [Zingiber officinale]